MHSCIVGVRRGKDPAATADSSLVARGSAPLERTVVGGLEGEQLLTFPLLICLLEHHSLVCTGGCSIGVKEAECRGGEDVNVGWLEF